MSGLVCPSSLVRVPMFLPIGRSGRIALSSGILVALGLAAAVAFWAPPGGADGLTHALLAVVALTATWGFVGQIRDSGRHLRANELRLAAQGAALMELTARQMERASSVEERLAWILETCARTLDAGRVSIWRFNEDATAIHCLDLFDLAAGSHSSGVTLQREGYPAYFRALEEERFIAAEDAARDRRTREFTTAYLTPHGIRSMLDVPLRRKDEVSGVLCVEHVGSARRWTCDERNFVLSVANLIVAAVATDERREALRRLAESEARARLIVDTAPDAFVGADEHGEIVSWNAQAAATFGWTAEEALGRPLAETIIPPGLRRAHLAGLRRLQTTGMSSLANQRIELTGLHRDGHEFPIEIAISPPIEIRGRVFIGAFLRDISERHERVAELRRAKESAEGATRAKSEFLANMSHELRTPLNGVLGYAQLLQRDRSLGPRHQEALDAIARCGTHLLDLINDVLDLSKIEAGRIEIEAAPCDLRQVALDVRHMVAERARRKDLDLDVEVDDGVPGRTVLDGRHLRQILLNLLGNAVKFTEAGRVTLAIARTAESLRFEVADTGIGIEAESLEAIFEAFGQTKSGAAAGGTGLGLTISQRLVRLMGGQLHVESAPGRGSRFSFELPIEESREGPFDAPDRWLGARLAAGDRVTALVVDDSSVNRRLLAALLESAGIHAITAGGGQEAVHLATEHRPDVMLIDLRMADLDGLEVTRRLRDMGALADCPVIAVTASAFDDTRAAALAAGCVAVLTKPIRAGQLFAMLAEHASVRFEWPQPEAGRAEPPAPRGGITAGSGARLRQAAAAGNIAGVEAVVEELTRATGRGDPLVLQIATLADVFDYDTLVELADALDRQRGDSCAAHH
jgi:PAS domain S-box-containing protein